MQSSWRKPLVVAALTGTLILLPVQFITLPLNMSPVELWNLLTLPFLWLYLFNANSPVRMPYIVAIWAILLGSFFGTFGAPSPASSFVAIMKDVYLYSWFVTVTTLLADFDARTFRWLMLTWTGVVVVHGILVVAQFVSPSVFQTSLAFAAAFGGLDVYRPSGLFANANSTALYQLMGFVPLLICRLGRTRTSILSAFVLLTIFATGSFAGLAGFAIGVVVAILGNALVSSRGGATLRAVMVVAIPTIMLVGLVYVTIVTTSPEVTARLQYLIFNRASGSADGRFDLWLRGLDELSLGWPWGIGPGSYPYFDLIHKTLHNDALEFAIERGLIGLIGLVILAVTALGKGIQLIWQQRQPLNPDGALLVVCLAAVAAGLINGLFHQIFHDRSFWLVLAVQEALLIRLLIRGRVDAPSSPPEARQNQGRLRLPRPGSIYLK